MRRLWLSGYTPVLRLGVNQAALFLRIDSPFTPQLGRSEKTLCGLIPPTRLNVLGRWYLLARKQIEKKATSSIAQFNLFDEKREVHSAPFVRCQ